ncbi:PfkB family carbohydrate kinase [Lapillicoccus jejuensis]|uniref:Sugar/nucleoside kinase (Ribokinase family) n=1 Tax=Lapillicoccus jejuensis TaxID=402171 RepID=A0A542E363_9MICO|nr:PfkB family carbohydrate kinase [Lapillicoccus jejuensis]TQJ09772.1 sugar/nucleoside kinase (ribokinase family) [Lapillicoccus jejuensis]
MTGPVPHTGPRVVHTAQALVDEVVEVDVLPPRGGNAVARARHLRVGGAVTVLLAAARDGAAAVLTGSVGTGPHGDLVRAALDADGVLVASPVVADADTGVCLVVVEASAERTFITRWGAERQVTAGTLLSADPVAGDLLCVSGFTLEGPTCAPLLEALDRLDDRVVVVVDPGSAFAQLDDDVRRRVLDRTDVWSGNAEESAALTGEADPAAAAGAVLGRLPRARATAVVRDGARGCVVVVRGEDGGRERVTVPGVPVTALDTNGAGDTHTGVLLAARAAGLDWAAAARRANAAGALKVSERGADGPPTAARIDELLARLDG